MSIIIIIIFFENPLTALSLELKSQFQTFYLLNWCRSNEGIAHICPWYGFWVNCPITYGPLKKGEVHIKE